MSEAPKRKSYVNEGLTEEGLRLYRTGVTERVCPLHRSPIMNKRRVWCDTGLVSCYWLFHHQYGRVQDWKRVRREAIERDGHKCVNCGTAEILKKVAGYDPETGAIEVEVHAGGARLEVDHIVEIRDGGAEFDLSNVRTLCHGCHVAKTVARTRGWQAEKALKLIRTPQPRLTDP